MLTIKTCFIWNKSVDGWSREGLWHNLTGSKVFLQAYSIDQEVPYVRHFDALIVVSVALELQLDKYQMWFSYKNFATRPNFVGELLRHMVNGHHAEVMLEVH